MGNEHLRGMLRTVESIPLRGTLRRDFDAVICRNGDSKKLSRLSSCCGRNLAHGMVTGERYATLEQSRAAMFWLLYKTWPQMFENS